MRADAKNPDASVKAHSGRTCSPPHLPAARLDRTAFAQGLGVHAPCELTYEVKPEYRRFVALAGADENLIAVSHGSNLAKYPSVVFKVLLDGRDVATSPVRRVQFPAWRFNVEIPPGAKRISLVTMDAGDGTREDFADWANAGFVVGN